MSSASDKGAEVPLKDKESDNTSSDDIEKETETNEVKKNEVKYFPRLQKHVNLARYQRLATEEDVLRRSMNACTFAAFCIALNTKILQPNYAIMAFPGASPESFDSTVPFDFNSATYFIPMTSTLGVAIASTVTGTLSDKIGRKPIVLFCSIGCTIGSVVKYFCRHTFWGFNAANFVTGLLSGVLPVALGYVGDIYVTNDEKQDGFASLVSFWMFGQSFGGIIAILLESTGLFAPLLVGAAFQVIATIIAFKYMVEAGEISFLAVKKAKAEESANDEDDDFEAPDEINQVAFMNIVWGAFFDNVGSQALFPLCLSPLALDQFYKQFVAVGEVPVMSLTGYKWISALVALMVIPSAMVCPKLFEKIGAAAACVFGNTMTAIITICLLYLGSGQATEVKFGLFVAVMYLGFPFTVISQLTTSPMLDMISPKEKRGYVQGVNSTVMNVSIAIAPWVLGLMADAVGTFKTIWTGIGISFLAGAVNSPLMFRKGFGPQPKKLPPQSRPVSGEDKDLIERILNHDYTVSQEQIARVNLARRQKGLPHLTIHSRTYEEDKADGLNKIIESATPSILFMKDYTDAMIDAYNKKDDDFVNILEQFNKSKKCDTDDSEAVYKEIGRWFADYIKDAGYNVHNYPLLTKQFILTAFPPLTFDKEITAENVEAYALHQRRLIDQYLKITDDKENKYAWENIFGTGHRPTIYG